MPGKPRPGVRYVYVCIPLDERRDADLLKKIDAMRKGTKGAAIARWLRDGAPKVAQVGPQKKIGVKRLVI